MRLALFGGYEPMGESFRDRFSAAGSGNLLVGLCAWGLAVWAGFDWLRDVAIAPIVVGIVQLVLRAFRGYRRSHPESLTSLTEEQYARRVAERTAANDEQRAD